MRTQYIASVELDSARLAKDLAQSESFTWSEAYSDYLFGGPWRSAMLWALGGDSGDGVMTNYAYDQQASFTGYGRQVPYLQELVTGVADLSRLVFVRLATVANSVIIPHRDLLEFTEIADERRISHRVHIPLVTHDNCFFSERNTVFRMRTGEIWGLNAAQMHSVASLTDQPRTHLIFDFADRPGPGPLVTVERENTGPDIPADRTVVRPPLPDDLRARLLGLADVLTTDTFSEVFSIIIKQHFRYDGGENFVWDTITAIARACKDPAVLPHTLELHRYYTLERSA
jgi:L-proline cis-4-hydroxylase